jgi:hypothetical protein
MKRILFVGLMLASTFVAAAESEDALKAKMKEACAPLFAADAPCDNLAKGSRNCVRQNKDKGGASCVAFEKANPEFFDAGKNDPIIKK